jgi:hypothetical protein
MLLNDEIRSSEFEVVERIQPLRRLGDVVATVVMDPVSWQPSPSAID